MYCERVAIFSTLVGFISRLGVAVCHAAEACYNVITEGGETVDVLSLAQVTGGLRLRELLTRPGGDSRNLRCCGSPTNKKVAILVCLSQVMGDRVGQ